MAVSIVCEGRAASWASRGGSDVSRCHRDICARRTSAVYGHKVPQVGPEPLRRAYASVPDVEVTEPAPRFPGERRLGRGLSRVIPPGPSGKA
jgi:hypothetical protein